MMDKKYIKITVFALAVMIGFILLHSTGCAKPEIEMSPIELPLGDTDLTVCDYTTDMAQGCYGFFDKNDVRIMFFGIAPYTLLESEKKSIKDNEKAVVVGLSAYKMRNTAATLNGSDYELVDVQTGIRYKPKMTKDNDIAQFVKAESRKVYCYRLIYAVPKSFDIDQCVFVATERGDEAIEHVYAKNANDEALEDGAVSDRNLCPICADEEYTNTALVVCTCPVCGRTYISDHTPAQEICYACSVMNNWCTQCRRYIDHNINEKENDR